MQRDVERHRAGDGYRGGERRRHTEETVGIRVKGRYLRDGQTGRKRWKETWRERQRQTDRGGDGGGKERLRWADGEEGPGSRFWAGPSLKLPGPCWLQVLSAVSPFSWLSSEVIWTL